MKKYLLILLCAFFISTSWAAIEVYEFDTPEQEAQFRELGNTLRCPKCQNNSIADSNAALAEDLREKVYQMTKAGQSKQDIIDYMVARYGNFVTYKPPFTLGTAILWFAPIIVLLLGMAAIVLRHRQMKQQKTTQHWNTEKEARLQALLNTEQADPKGDKSE